MEPKSLTLLQEPEIEIQDATKNVLVPNGNKRRYNRKRPFSGDEQHQNTNNKKEKIKRRRYNRKKAEETVTALKSEQVRADGGTDGQDATKNVLVPNGKKRRYNRRRPINGDEQQQNTNNKKEKIKRRRYNRKKAEETVTALSSEQVRAVELSDGQKDNKPKRRKGKENKACKAVKIKKRTIKKKEENAAATSITSKCSKDKKSSNKRVSGSKNKHDEEKCIDATADEMAMQFLVTVANAAPRGNDGNIIKYCLEVIDDVDDDQNVVDVGYTRYEDLKRDSQHSNESNLFCEAEFDGAPLGPLGPAAIRVDKADKEDDTNSTNSLTTLVPVRYLMNEPSDKNYVDSSNLLQQLQ